MVNWHVEYFNIKSPYLKHLKVQRIVNLIANWIKDCLAELAEEGHRPVIVVNNVGDVFRD